VVKDASSLLVTEHQYFCLDKLPKVVFLIPYLCINIHIDLAGGRRSTARKHSNEHLRYKGYE
jgi:hypothetical protein